MGKITSKLARPIRTFNVENRATRVLQRQDVKPEVAPKHLTTKEAISQLQHDNPEILEAEQMKNEALHENLKKIYVESVDGPIDIKPSSKPLPSSRKYKPDTDLGSWEVEYQVPEGRIDLKTLLHLMTQHYLEPQRISAEYIAEQHKLDIEEVKNILKYYKSLHLHLPKVMFEKNPNLKEIIQKQMSQANLFRISSDDSEQKQIGQKSMTDSVIGKKP